MMTNRDILEIIYEAVDEINEDLPKSKQIAKSPDTALFGKDGKLDSLGLVNLIVGVEGLLDEKSDQAITLADEKAMSQNNSPFRTIGTLSEYILILLES